MLKRALHYFTFLCLVGLLVTGCSDTSTIDNPPVPATNPTPFPGFTWPIQDLANSRLPLPNDILLNPATGNLAFPQTTEPFVAANTLDGWSTAGDIIVEFRGNVVESSFSNATFLVINTRTGQPAPMTFSFTDTQEGYRMSATPVFPLEPTTRYLVILTNGIQSADSGSSIISDNNINILKGTAPLVDGNGNSTNSALSNAQAAQLEPIRAAYQSIWEGAERATGQSRADIPLAFAFTTQSLRQTLLSLRPAIVNDPPTLVGANPNAPNPAFANLPVAAGNPNQVPAFAAFGVPSVPQLRDGLVSGAITIPGVTLSDALRAQLAAIDITNIGRIHVVSFEAPIYRADNAEGFWSEPPVQVGTRTVPGLVFLPLAVADPTVFRTPLPVMIFQHGITGQKELAFGLASGVNGQNYALIAIDLELHGALSKTGATSPGDGFINLANLRNSRDNIRTSVTNLYALTATISAGRTGFDDNTGLGINPTVNGPAFIVGSSQAPASPIYVGHSLGAIVGQIFQATDDTLVRSALNVGGGRISKLLNSSDTFGPIVRQGLLDAAGLVQGTTQFDQFFLVAQAIIDDADPINYGQFAIDNGRQILQQVNIVDTVVPNAAQVDLAIQHAQGTSNPAFTQVDAIVTQALITAQASTPFAGPGMYEIPTFSHGAILGTDGAAAAAAIFGQAFNFTATGAIVDTGIRARQLPVEPAPIDIEAYRGAFEF